MRRTILLAFLLQLVGSILTATAADNPNIVLMLSDDQAWNGLSVPMHPEVAESRGRFYSTPNLERLAAQGMRFSQAYAPAPVCSPTRISLQTGMSPAQLHWTKAAPPVEGMKLIEPHLIKNIGDDVVTIGELLRDAGYATAHYGKWHIGGGGPGRHGYEEHDGDTGNENAAKFVDPNPVDIFGMADRAEQFMAKAKRDRKPFFIQLSWNALHASENASKAALAKYEKLMSVANEKAISTAAITEDLDRGVGRVLDSIDKLALKDSTYVIYMSDNGAGGGSAGGNAGGGKRGGLRGGKGGVWEGGLRVPFIIRGPGIAADAWCHVPIVGYDLFPTFAALACIPKEKIPARVEGGSIVDLLHRTEQSPTQTSPVHRRFEGIVFHFPHYQSEGPQSSILVGSYKLVHIYEDGSDALFDLSKDIGERSDLSRALPQEAQRLRTMLDTYLKKVDAQLPTVNTSYNPKTQPPADAMRGKKGQNKNNKPKGNQKAS